MQELIECKSRQREKADHVQTHNTGIPMAMKESFESRSGLSFDDVVIHYRSDKPARYGAAAYTQGRNVFIGPGQERSLPHELVHVAQQKQGLVKPTTWLRGQMINAQPSLEWAAQQGIVERRPEAGEYPFSWTMPVQFDRTPTFYTYLRTPSGNRLQTNRQGPHTIPHVYYEFLIQNYDWTEIFEQMIPNPTQMRQLIAEEHVEFDRTWAEHQIKHEHYNDIDPGQLSYHADNWEADFDNRMERFYRDYEEAYSHFWQSRSSDDLMKLLNMHPYATYAWRGCMPSREELAGKGERRLINKLNESHAKCKNVAFAPPSVWRRYIDMGWKGRKPFRSKSRFQAFLESRLWFGVRKESVLQSLVQTIAEQL